MVIKEQQLATIIYSRITEFASAIATSQIPHRAEISPKYGLNTGKYIEYAQHDLYQLAEALIADNPPQFVRYILWQRSMLRGHLVPDSFVFLQLETEQTLLLKILPVDYHPILLRFLQSAKDALEETANPGITSLPDQGTINLLATDYTRILLEGERSGASTLVINAINNGISIKDIYLKVFQPSLYQVGIMWQTGRITVAHEHYFTAATQLIMSEFYPLIHKNALKDGRMAVNACVEGELHEIGLRMSADLMELSGWRTCYLGANTPQQSIIDIVKEKKAKILMLSMCLPTNGPALRALISSAKKQLGNCVKLVIGGYSISSDPVYAASFGADAVATNAGDAPLIAAQLLEQEQNDGKS